MNYHWTFIGEFGRKRLSYPAYLQDSELRGYMNDPDRMILHLGLTILTYDRDWLERHEDELQKFNMLKAMSDENPLQFFLPSSIQTSGAVDFLNDTETDVKFLIAGNRRGKTASWIIDLLLDAVPTSPEWPIFKFHGVKHRKFYKPLKVGMATSDWTICQRVLWPEVRKWLPRYELGEYDPRIRDHKDIAWRVNPSMQLKCGTELFFFCYEQKQGAFEGMALDRFGWDEQGEEPKWDGADERLRTRKGRHVHGLTPHVIEGRPDTGARSWMHKMVTGEVSKGHTVKCYNIGPDDVPDWVYPETEKVKAYEKWIASPTKNNDMKVLAEGRSRYFGEWHETGGLMYDEWDENYHLVDPFPIPDSWTRYRAVDHGTVNPTAALCIAVSPEGFLYAYAEYYRSGMSVFQNARGIVAACGNELRSIGHSEVGGCGMYYERFEEITKTQRFKATVLDSRSGNTKDGSTHLDIKTLYMYAGLRTTDASGANSEKSIPIVKEFLRIDTELIHPHRKDLKGSPRLMVFRNLENFIREIKGYAKQEYASSKIADKNNPKEKPVEKNNHTLDCLKYILQIPPKYIQDQWGFSEQKKVVTEEDEEKYDREREAKKRGTGRDRVTGY